MQVGSQKLFVSCQWSSKFLGKYHLEKLRFTDEILFHNLYDEYLLFLNECESIVLSIFWIQVSLCPSILLYLWRLQSSAYSPSPFVLHSQSGHLLGVPDSEWICIKHQYMFLCSTLFGEESQLPKYFIIFFRHRIFDLRKEGRFLPSSFIKASVSRDQFTSALRWTCIACCCCFLRIHFRLLYIYWRFLSSFFTE